MLCMQSVGEAHNWYDFPVIEVGESNEIKRNIHTSQEMIIQMRITVVE